MSKKYTIEEVREFFKKKGYKLISKEYFKNTMKLILEDNDGYLYFVSLNSIKSHHIPDKFNMSNPYTIHNIKLWCKINNKPFELVSELFVNAHIKLKWQCLKEDCGEIFDASWNSVSVGKGCGVCVGRQIHLSNCLATLNPELASEWHPTMNGKLTPFDVTVNSNKYVWWQCKDNPKHEWFSSIHNRNDKESECPYCSHRLPSKDYNLLVCNLKLTDEWDYNKNNKRPEDYTPTSIEDVWWKCEKGHSWSANIYNRNNKHQNCPYCSGLLPSEENNLLVDNQELCKEWNYKKNKREPNEYTPHSSKSVWWKCLECDHTWEAPIKNRNKKKGTGCPECSESKGEKISRKYFDLNNDNYISQKKFEGLIGLGHGLLSYDFYLPSHNILYEYQGEQHERYIPGFHKSFEDFERQVEHDRRKKEYAEQNGYNFLEIWYWDFDNIEKILEQVLGGEN